MESNTFLSSNQQNNITYYKFIPTGSIKHVVQIVHGMAEYIDRYHEFVSFLNEHGIVVYGHDHMGHGRSIHDFPGNFKNCQQATNLVEDVLLLNKIIKKEYPDCKITILGHSMGSFISRIALSKDPTCCHSLILSGTGAPNPLAPIGKYVALLLTKIKGPTYKSKLLDTLSFGTFNKRIDHPKTKFDWLSISSSNVQKYIEDPLCGFLFSTTGFCVLTDLVVLSNQTKSYQSIPASLPIFLISGANDPVGDYGRGVEKVTRRYLDNNCFATMKLYPAVRHEILLDKSKHEVFHDILKFIIKE